MTSRTKLNVQSFPRPARLEKTSRHIRITYQGQEVADTKEAYWVLETHHPPSACPPLTMRLVARHEPLRAGGRKGDV